MADKIFRPFHCGTQFADWENANCCECRKSSYNTGKADEMPECEIEQAMVFACFDAGEVTEDIAERCGYLDNSPPRQERFSYNWRCKEFEPIPEPGVPVPLKPMAGQKELFNA